MFDFVGKARYLVMKNIRKEIRISRRDHKRIIKSRRMRRMSARFITVFSLFLLFITITGAINSFAGSTLPSSDSSDTEYKKCYTSIMIYPGDSIDSITDKYYTSQFKDKDSLAFEILSINHLSPEKTLEPGNHIIVPVYNLMAK